MARGAPAQAGIGGRVMLGVPDFTGGRNTRVSKFLIRDNQAQECVNFFFNLGGVMKVRPGFTQKNTSFGVGGILGGARYYPATGSSVLLADWGTTIQASTDGGVTFASLALPSGVTLAAFSQSQYTQVKDFIYRSDGINQPLRYDGTALQKWGITGPSVAPSAAQTTGGAKTNGAYLVSVTFVTPTQESNQSPTVSVSITGANNAISLSAIPLGPAGSNVTSRRLYVTKVGGAILYFEMTLADNTTTTATLVLADSALGGEAPTDKDPPPTDINFTALFKNRMIAVRASNLRQLLIGELFQPEAFPLANVFTIPFPKGDRITGLKARGDLFFIFGTATIFVMLGDTPFNFIIRQTFADEGSVSQWGIVEVENVLMYPSRFGYMAFDGANSKILSLEIEPTLRAQTDLTQMSTIAGAYDIQNRVVRWAHPVGANYGTRKEQVFDLFHRGWTESDRKVAIYWPFMGGPDRGELYTGDPNNGIINQENVGTSDNGANILAKYRTKAFNFQQPRLFKRFWHLYADFRPSSGSLSIEAKGDDGLALDTFSPSIAGVATYYSTGNYGVDSYGGVLIAFYDEGFTFDPAIPKDFVAKYVEFFLQYTGTDAFEFYRLDAETEVDPWLRKT